MEKQINIGDILRMAVEKQLPIDAKYGNEWVQILNLTREKAVEINMEASAVRIIFPIP